MVLSDARDSLERSGKLPINANMWSMHFLFFETQASICEIVLRLQRPIAQFNLMLNGTSDDWDLAHAKATRQKVTLWC